MTSAASPSELVFEAGELALIVRTEPSPFRMRETRRVAVQLSPDDAEQLALKLLAYSAQARRERAPTAFHGHDGAIVDFTEHA